MKTLALICLITLFACTKSPDGDCQFTGTWQQVIKFPGEPEVYGLKMELLKDGSMKMGGITGLKWRVKDECSIFEYWGKEAKNITIELKVLAFDGHYLSLEFLSGALATDPFSLLGSWDFKRIE